VAAVVELNIPHTDFVDDGGERAVGLKVGYEPIANDDWRKVLNGEIVPKPVAPRRIQAVISGAVRFYGGPVW
jgi:hypothetical protein